MNGLNAPIKRYRVSEEIKKQQQQQDPLVCCLQENLLGNIWEGVLFTNLRARPGGTETPGRLSRSKGMDWPCFSPPPPPSSINTGPVQCLHYLQKPVQCLHYLNCLHCAHPAHLSIFSGSALFKHSCLSPDAANALPQTISANPANPVSLVLCMGLSPSSTGGPLPWKTCTHLVRTGQPTLTNMVPVVVTCPLSLAWKLSKHCTPRSIQCVLGQSPLKPGTSLAVCKQP